VFAAPIICLPIVNHDNNQHAANENLRLQNLWTASTLTRLDGRTELVIHENTAKNFKRAIAVARCRGADLVAQTPALLRVGANYSAKIVCSNVFLAARNPTKS